MGARVDTFRSADERDAEITAPRVGDIAVLQDTGEVTEYAGPVAGWRAPWNSAWGLVDSSALVTSVSVLDAPSVNVLIADLQLLAMDTAPNREQVAALTLTLSCAGLAAAATADLTLGAAVSDGITASLLTTHRTPFPKPQAGLITVTAWLPLPAGTVSVAPAYGFAASSYTFAAGDGPRGSDVTADSWLRILDFGPSGSPA